MCSNRRYLHAERTPTTSIQGGGERVQANQKHIPKWEERVRLHSKSLWKKNKIFKNHRPRSHNREAHQALPPRKFYTYILLNILWENVLIEIKGYILEPQRLWIPSNRRNPNKFCLCHRDHDHYTNKCIQLWDEIKELTRRSHLDHFIQHQKELRDRPRSPRLVNYHNSLNHRRVVTQPHQGW